MGTSLMVRGPGGVVLTEAGKLLEPRIHLVLGELGRAVDAVKHISYSSQGKVVLGSPSLPFFTILPSAIKQFQKQFPLVNIHLSEGQFHELLSGVRSGKLDFAIGITADDTSASEFIEEPLFTTSFCIVARQGHPLANSRSIKQLRGAKWYLPTFNQGYYNKIEGILFPEPESAQTIIRGDSFTAGLQMMLDADFLTVASIEMLKVPFLSEHVCIIPVSEAFPDAVYSFIYSQRLPLTLVARKLIDKLHDAVAKQLLTNSPENNRAKVR